MALRGNAVNDFGSRNRQVSEPLCKAGRFRGAPKSDDLTFTHISSASTSPGEFFEVVLRIALRYLLARAMDLICFKCHVKILPWP